MAKTQYLTKPVIISLLFIWVVSTNFQWVSHAQNLAVIFDLYFMTYIQLACQVNSTSEILCLLKWTTSTWYHHCYQPEQASIMSYLDYCNNLITSLLTSTFAYTIYSHRKQWYILNKIILQGDFPVEVHWVAIAGSAKQQKKQLGPPAHPNPRQCSYNASNVWLWGTPLRFQGFGAIMPTMFPCGVGSLGQGYWITG